jgi:RNA polymerase-binding transcription factor DksA
VNNRASGGITPVLPAEDLAALRENLNDQRLFRREQVRRLTQPQASRAQGGAARQTAARAEVDAKLAAYARMVLTDVEAALRRMDEGSYGICHLCRCSVGLERLRIVPQARYCGRCRQAEEAGP